MVGRDQDSACTRARGRTERAVALALVLALGGPSPAHATVGGPIEIEVLGRDSDGRTYLVEHRRDESDSVPQLFVIARGETLPVLERSWYARGSPSALDDPRAIEARLEELRARLSPLASVAPDRIDVRSRILSRGSHRDAPDLPTIPSFRMRVRVRHEGAASTTELQAFASSEVRLAAAWSLPSGGTLIVLRYRGVPIETTYDRDTVIVIQAPGG